MTSCGVRVFVSDCLVPLNDNTLEVLETIGSDGSILCGFGNAL